MWSRNELSSLVEVSLYFISFFFPPPKVHFFFTGGHTEFQISGKGFTDIILKTASLFRCLPTVFRKWTSWRSLQWAMKTFLCKASPLCWSVNLIVMKYSLNMRAHAHAHKHTHFYVHPEDGLYEPKHVTIKKMNKLCRLYSITLFNRLTPNDPYMGYTAPLTSKRFILYVYSTNIGTEYFKHALYSPFFSLQNAVCFIMLTCLVSVLFTFYIQGVLKLKK